MVRLKELLHLRVHFLLKVAGTVTLAAVVTACGTASLGPGMTREQVVSRMGQPTRTVALAAGGQRLQYSYQPYGQQAVMVDLDPSGRDVQVRQVLNESDFSRIRPAAIQATGFEQGEAWSHRRRERPLL